MRLADLIPGATETLRARIHAKTVRGGRGECWRWTGAVSRKRGGSRAAIQVGGRGSRTISVARVLLVLKDRVPLADRDAAKLEAGHTCHQYWCVKPNHLRWETREENESRKYEHASIRARRMRREAEKQLDDMAFERFAAEVDEIIEKGPRP